jgi:hypothetical protein
MPFFFCPDHHIELRGDFLNSGDGGWHENPLHDTNMRVQSNPALAQVFLNLVGSNPSVLEQIP